MVVTIGLSIYRQHQEKSQQYMVGVCYSQPKHYLTPPLYSMGTKKYHRRLEGQEKDREGSLTRYGHEQDNIKNNNKHQNIKLPNSTWGNITMF